MRFIYEDIAKKLLTSDRVLKYKNWVEEAEKARNAGSLSAKENQYDKAEELITFYTFAPLEHENVPNEVKNHVVEGILSFVGINEPVREVKIHFEKDLPPPDYYLKWLSGKVKEHLIGYIRREAETKTILEGPTQVDAIVETDNLLILIEVKFTSDISPYTRFGLIRNQIARLIDAGISKALACHKKLVILLCTPSELFQRRSRLYYYKMQEYSEPGNIQKDIPWRKIEEINGVLEKATWISLEKTIGIVYHNVKRFLGSKEFIEAERFFKERMLWAPV
jgi:hypothetical protein